MRKTISVNVVDGMAPGAIITDKLIPGFRARLLNQGGRVLYEVRYRSPVTGRRVSLALGKDGQLTPDEARKRAKIAVGIVADGKDPAMQRREARANAENTVDAVLDEFVARYLKDRASGKHIADTYNRLVRPIIGKRSINLLERIEIARMLDKIEDKNGKVMATRTLAYVRSAFNWHARRDGSFRSPIVPGMGRSVDSEHARDRTLDPQELRDLFAALDQLGDSAPACYPDFIRALLFSTLRRTAVMLAHSDEFDGDDWTVPGKRTKHGKPHICPLTPHLRKLMGGRKGFVFSSDGGVTPFSGDSKAKAALDAKINEIRARDGRKPMPHWIQHDLRRTARTLLTPLVPHDHAEATIGHLIPGVAGVYNRYAYKDEKRAALEKLAAHIHGIVGGGGAKVVRFPRRKAA